MIWLAMQILISLFSLRGRRAFFEADWFSWVAAVEGRWHAIRRELDAVLAESARIPNFKDISEDQAVLADGDEWKTFFLFTGGRKAEVNCLRCPETAAAVELIPGMQTAMFSILRPKTHLPRHRGLYKGVLRYHLGLLIPEPPESCRIEVRGETRYWEEGKSLIFDDTYRHEAWNDSDHERVVLFVDFERPLPFPLSALNRMVIRRFGESAFVENAIDRVRKTSAAAVSQSGAKG